MRAWELAILLPYLLPSLSLAFDECLTPTLDNGWIEAAPGSGPDSFVGRFRCREGFLLSGESRVKCRAGVWSQASLPVCTALMACPEEQLPNIENGYRRGVAQLQNSVYRYKCYSGFRLMGARSVHCDGHNWVTTELPICTRRGCDPADLFGSEVAQFEHGRVRSIYGGAAYRFKCNRGALMSGDRTVFCDGHRWNSTRPDCLVPAAVPVLSVEPLHSGSVQVGQRLTFTCRSQGGNPSPSLAFMINNQPAAAENGEDGEIFLSIDVGEQHQGAQVVCTAINSVSRRPVYSKFHLIRIQFAPTEVYMTGPSLAKPGDLLSFSCNSDEADPSPDLVVVALDETGTRLAASAQEPQPSMKTSRGWVSSTRMQFQTGPGVKRVEVQCTATNAMGEATTSVATQMQYLPETVEVEGPSDVVRGEEATFSCQTGPAFPKPQIVWTKRMGNTVTEVAEEETEVDIVELSHGVSQVSRYTLRLEGDIEDQDLSLECSVINPGTGERKTSQLHKVALSHPSTTTSTTTATTTTVASTTSSTSSTSTSTETKFTEYPEYSVSEAQLHGDDESSSEFNEEGVYAKDLETKEESFDKEMSVYEDVEDEESYEDDEDAVEESHEEEEDAVEESYEDSEASYGESDKSYGDGEGSYEDYEGFYDDQEELFGEDQDGMYSDEDYSESESDVRTKIVKKEDENDSDAGVEVKKSTGKKFSDLNGLTDLASENKNDGIVKQQDSGLNLISRGKIAHKDDLQESREGSKDEFKHLDFSEENISMGGSFHPDNLNAVHSEDVQRNKGLEAENEENAKWSSADESLGVEANWGTDKKMKDNADQEVFLGKYTQEPEENGDFLAAMPADTPTFNLKSKDRPTLTADFSSKALQSSGVGGGSNAASSIHMFIFSVLLARILA